MYAGGIQDWFITRFKKSLFCILPIGLVWFPPPINGEGERVMSAFQRGFPLLICSYYVYLFPWKASHCYHGYPFFFKRRFFPLFKKIYCYECGENAETSTNHVVLKLLELFRGLSMLASWLAMSHNPFSPIELALRPRFVPLIQHTKKKTSTVAPGRRQQRRHWKLGLTKFITRSQIGPRTDPQDPAPI